MDTTTPEPLEYRCRCGLPESCVCPWDFPDQVIGDLNRKLARVRALPRWENPDTGITYVDADQLDIALEPDQDDQDDR